MQYVFYADIFFITNFIMDYVILRITGMLRKKKIHTTSYLLGSFCGAAMLTLLITAPVDFGVIGKVTAYFAVSFFMCMVTFGRKNGRDNVKSWLCLYAVAFTAGGILDAIYFYTNFPLMTKHLFQGAYLKNMSIFTFFISAGISYLGLRGAVKVMQVRMGRTGKKDDIVEVILFHRGVTREVRALFDSGNSLKEPISGAPVHIVDLQTAESILTEGGTEEKLRLVPFHSLGKKEGIMTAFECEKMEVIIKGDKIDLGPAYLGIYRGELCAGKKYRMILNRSINQWL